TTVVYMARATLAAFRNGALAAGIDPATPAIAIFGATRPDEARVSGTVTDLPERLGELPSKGPVLVIIGHAMGAAVSAAIRQQARA
ncbi:MAG: uroporphyrinogen-III C-methyltransferase, partial [Bosea sp.]|nr:uroporphyrinogen-III C-methyltransferase [Bosea sp. (in: a-proteobacteria)]